jgi:hypothetical protein
MPLLSLAEPVVMAFFEFICFEPVAAARLSVLVPSLFRTTRLLHHAEGR